MKSWVKGGLIFLAVIVVLSMYGVFGGTRPCIPESCKGEYLPFGNFAQGIVSLLVLPLTPLMFLLSSFVENSLFVNIFGFVVVISYLFGVGALIGFVIGKVRQKEKH